MDMEGWKEDEIRNKGLMSPCGLYCGACGIYQGRIKQAVNDLRKVIGAYGFDKIAPELAKWEPSLKHYAEFEQVMDGFVKGVNIQRNDGKKEKTYSKITVDAEGMTLVLKIKHGLKNA
jgi:hypothetical protein